MHAEVDLSLPLPGLSPVCGKPVVARFDGGQLSSDGGILLLAQVERRLGIAERLARCIEDPRAPDQIRHEVAEMIRFRALAIAAGYPDANDCDVLRKDPAFKMAVGRLPETGADLCSQPTMTRLENLPGPVALKRMMAAMVELFCDSFEQVPRRIVLDIDDTEDRATGSSSSRSSMHITTAAASCRSTSTRRFRPNRSRFSCGRARRPTAWRSAWCCAMSCAPSAPAGRASIS